VCGAELPDAGEHEARKVVTALFCDLVGFTTLGEQLDPEALHTVLSRYFEAISATIERHGGSVQKFAGDAVLAIFGIPRAHEDDALRAVRAAVEIGERLPRLAAEVGVPLRVRTGLNTGLVLTDGSRNLAMGDAVNVAARLEQAAQPDEVIIGAGTLRLVRDAVEVEALAPLILKGKSEPVAAFRLLSVDRLAPGLARRLDAPLVGRERELRLLRDVWGRTVEESDCHLFTLLGVAGVGKSRLVAELIEHAGGAVTTLSGRCLPYGEGITFWPIIEALTTAGDAGSPIIDRLSSGGAATPEELFWEVRQLLEAMARQRPVILHVDDLHWAQPMLVDLLDHIVDLSRGAPILVLCTARPELLEDHTGWAGGKLNSTSVGLEPLGNAECERLLDQLGHELDRKDRALVIATSEGNPLFLEEMVVLARETGSVDVPPTIRALLTARLERLSASERDVLERGAIEGQVFHVSAVTALAGSGPAMPVETQLAALVRKDLIRPHPANVPGETAFRFRHLLIRDAAYERLPKSTRADLHEKYAGWLEDAGVDFVEVHELAGWHLEQAVRHQRELRREVRTTIARRAAEHLYAAGRRAGDRSDVSAGRNLLERALALAPEDDPVRVEIGAALAERLIEAGDLARADQLLSLAEHEPDEFGPASLSRLEWLFYSQPAEATRMIESVLARMLEALASSDDDRGLAKAHWLAFCVQWAASRATLAAEQVRLAAEHARKCGDIGLWSRALGWYVATLMYGPTDAAAIARELAVIEEDEPGPYLAACVELGRAEVARLQGRFADARRLTQSALDGFRALGMRTMAATCDQSFASIQLSSGDPAAARVSLLRSEAILARFGERALRSTTQAMLARVNERLNRRVAARVALELAEELSDPRDLANFAITHGVRARLALVDGDGDAAESWARSSVDNALQTDFLGLRAEATLGLAQVLIARGRAGEARSEARAALELFRAKGDRPGSEAAQELLASEVN
jgi:class 3 adenylate cyclase